MKKLLLTGSSGLIGSEVFSHSNQLGWKIYDKFTKLIAISFNQLKNIFLDILSFISKIFELVESFSFKKLQIRHVFKRQLYKHYYGKAFRYMEAFYTAWDITKPLLLIFEEITRRWKQRLSKPITLSS